MPRSYDPAALLRRFGRLSPRGRAAVVGSAIGAAILLGGGSASLPALVSRSGYAPTLPPTPQLAAVLAAFRAHRYPLPAPGEKTVVLLVQRNTPSGGDPIDPFDDWIGCLWNEGGRIRWWCAPGTAEPGWLPMQHRGGIPTNPKGCARIAAPQYAPGAWGGGYHQWKESRPALREIGKLKIDRFDKGAQRWNPAGYSTSSINIHTAASSSNWRATVAKGVRDWSHGCPVLPDPANLATLRTLVGWTPDPHGISVNGAAFLIDAQGRIAGPLAA